MDSIGGVSLDTLVQQYRISQRKPALALENRKTSLKARLNALSDVKSKLDALLAAMKDLSLTGSSSKFLAFSVSSSLTNIATASASSAASKGSHTLLVTQLAKADTIVSSRLTSSATSVVTAEGTGTKTIRLSVNGTNTDINITLASGDTNTSILSNIAAAVNASGANVTASVVSDTSSTSKLVFTSKTTGSTNAVSLTDVTGTLLDNIGLTDAIISGRTASTSTTGGYLYSSTASLDANFKLDGIDIVRGTNTVSDALTGVTIELKATQSVTDTPVALTVGVDKATIRSKVEDFIKKYNEALTTLTAKTAVDPDTKVRQILAGDFVFRNLRTNLRGIASGAVSSVMTGNPKVLSDIGIKTASDGTLSLSDVAAFDSALDSDIAKVEDLFNSTNGIAVQLKTLTDSFVKTGGEIETTSSSASSQITNLTSQIKRFDEQLDRKVERFRDDFARIQSAIAFAARQQEMVRAILSGGFF